MTKKWHSHSLNSTFLNYKPQPTKTIIDEDESQRALFIGDLHGSDFSFIQQLILNNSLQLSTEDLDVLSTLAQSTYIDQLDMALSIYDELLENIQHQEENLENMKIQLQNTKTAFEREKRINFYDRAWLLKEKENIKKQEEKIYATDQALFLLKERQRQKYELCSHLKSEIIDELNSFKAILKRITILDARTLIWLLGDESADRANCGWRMLLLRQELSEREHSVSDDELNELTINSLLSNHGFELLYAYLTNRWFINDLPCFIADNDDPDAIPPEVRSLTNLKILLEVGIITLEEIAPAIESWINSLHLLTYSLSEDDNSISIYSHAPFGLRNPEGVKALAEKYGIDYCDSTKEDLGKTIDTINQRFQDSLDNSPLETIQTIHNLAKSCCNIHNDSTAIQDLADMIEQIESFKEHLNEEEKADLEKISKTFLYHICKDSKTGGSLYKLMWNRNRKNLDCPKEHPNGFHCYFVNGHDTPKETIEETDPSFNRYECDHDWGKPLAPQQAYYQYDPNATKTKVLQKTDTHITFSYFTSSEWGFTDWNSKCRQLPKHYFSDTITLSRETSPEEISGAIGHNMYQSTIPTILYGDEEDIELRYLEVTNEYLPELNNIHQIDNTAPETNSPNHINISLSPEPSPVDKLLKENVVNMIKSGMFSPLKLKPAPTTSNENNFTPVVMIQQGVY